MLATLFNGGARDSRDRNRIQERPHVVVRIKVGEPMSWARLDDRFPGNAKICKISDSAFRLYVTAVCFCCEHGTNGALESGHPQGFPRAPHEVG